MHDSLRPKLLCIIVSLGLSSAAIASAAIKPLATRGIDVGSGLSQNTVFATLQDQRGLVWIATEQGLNRYDGYELRQFHRSAEPGTGLPDSFVYDLAEGADGNVWIATARGGLAYWDPDQDEIRRFPLANASGEPIVALRALHYDKVQQRLWIGTLGAGLLQLTDGAQKAVPISHATDPTHIYDFAGTRDGSLLIGADRGVYRWRSNAQSLTPLGARRVEPGNDNALLSQVRSLLVDERGAFWAGTLGQGLFRFDPLAERFEPIAPYPSSESSDQRVHALAQLDSRRIWVGGNSGLQTFDLDSMQWETAQITVGSQPLKGVRVLSIESDANGLTWIGTRSHGSLLWNPRSWLLGHEQPPWSLTHNVTSFATSGEVTWIGTLGGGLIERRGNLDRVLGADAGLADQRVMTLAQDGRSQLWIGTMTAGLQVATRGSGEGQVDALRSVEARNLLKGTGIMSLLPANDGSLWVGTFGKGLYRLNAETHQPLRVGNQLNTLAERQVMALAEDDRGHIWAATDLGLFEIDAELGQQSAFLPDSNDGRSLPAPAVYSLHFDAQQQLWVGTSDAGLLRLERNAQGQAVGFHRLSVEPLQSRSVYGIQSDADGQLWLSTNSGIYRLNPDGSDLERFTPLKGAQGLEYNFGASHRSAAGELFFGGANGFNQFSPSELRVPQSVPNVILTSFERQHQISESDRPFTALRSIIAAPTDNVLDFKVALLDYADPNANRFSFFLEDFDENWRPFSSDRNISYTNLDPGSYRLLVRGISSAGVASDAPLAIDLTVEPPFWQTPLAQFLYALVLLALAAAFAHRMRLRTVRQRRYQAELEAKVAERTDALARSNAELADATQAKSDFLARMSHEIRTPMNGVYGTAQLLMRTALNADQQSLVDTIARSSESLLNIIGDILDFSKIEAGKLTLEQLDFDLCGLLMDCGQLFAGPARERGLELLLDLPAHPVTLNSDPTRIRQIVCNLLSNAIKFTEQGFVELRLQTSESGAAVIQVRDSGVGIPADKQALIFEDFAQADGSTTRTHGGTGLGLSICKQLASLMKAELTVQSTSGLGATFALQLPGTASIQERRPLSNRPKQVALLPSGAHLTDAVERWLTGEGISVLRVEAGELAALTPAEQKVKAILGSSASLQQLQPAWPEARRLQLCHADEPLVRGAERIAMPPSLGLLLDHLEGITNAAVRSDEIILEVSGELDPLLLVEDNSVNQEVITGMLTALGMKVRVASDGFEALNMMGRESFALVLMDCGLPEIDGLEVTRRLRASATRNAKVPVIALTANDVAGERERCLDAGMNDFLTKPCPIQALADRVADWLPAVRIASGPALPTPNADQEAIAANDDSISKPLPGGLDPEPLNRIRALERNGQAGLTGRILTLYLDDLDGLVDRIESAIADSDSAQVAGEAHRLKSASANIGAVALAELCRQLEEHCRRDDQQALERSVQQLKAMQGAVRQAVEQELNQCEERRA